MANLWSICPRHTGFGLAKTRVASGQRGPSSGARLFPEITTFKPIFHWKLGLHWLPNANEIYTKKKEMYMANARNLRLGPNATYIPLTCVGGFALGDTKNLHHPTQR